MALVSNKEAEGCFKTIDKDGSGFICLKEFTDFLKSQGQFSDDQIVEMFCGMQEDDGKFTDDDKKLTLAEFIDDVCRPNREKRIEEIFNEADKDNNDSLSWDELKSFLEGTCFNMDTMHANFDKAATDGKMSKGQLKQIMED